MAIMIPDSEEYKTIEAAVGRMADKERRSKTKMAVILIEEAILKRGQDGDGSGDGSPT